jgi:RNA polymerase primary sigma factor/RNA polymerase sigma factor
MTVRNKNGRSSALAKLCQFDLLSAEEERRLFLEFKRVKAQALRLRSLPPSRQARLPTEALAALSDEAVVLRNRIVESNLRLVVSLAKHFAAPQRSLEDLVSEASLPLIRCVESFDVGRGTRFSTYATRALRNFFAKHRRRDCRLRSRVLIDKDLSHVAAAQGRGETCDRLIRAEDLHRLRERLARLPRRERTLVAERFGLTRDRPPRTFRELGVRHGLSKERVRVITSEAISRLQQSFDEWCSP